MARKLINGNGPKELCGVFSGVRAEVSPHEDNLRSRLRSRTNMTIQPKQHRTARFERSTIYRMSKAWNTVSTRIKKINDPSKFKAAFQRELTHAYWGPSVTLRRP